MSQPTEFFKHVYHGDMGSICIDCHCGRTHFADSERAGDWEDGELEGLRERAAKEPDKYIAHVNYDAVMSLYIRGIVVVVECPCGWLYRYERMLWEDRERILKYFATRQRAEVDTLNRLGILIDDARPKVKERASNG